MYYISFAPPALEIDRRARAQVCRHVRDQVVEMLGADRLEHRRDVAVGMWHESHEISLSFTPLSLHSAYNSITRPQLMPHGFHRADRTAAARLTPALCDREFALRATRPRLADFSLLRRLDMPSRSAAESTARTSRWSLLPPLRRFEVRGN